MSHEPKDLAKARIIICESETPLAEQVAGTLRQLGYEVAGMVSTGKEAVQTAEESKAELIVLDRKLEGEIEGREAAEQIRSLVDIPIVYLTSNAEELLRRTGAYYRTLIETSPDPLVTVSADGKITDVNTATEKVTGHSRDRLIGTDFSDYFTDPERARAVYRQVFRDGCVKDYELDVRHKDGQVRSVLYNASVYRDESGEIAGVFAAARDISERKHAEELLKRAHQKLEQHVRERTTELQSTNDELLREIEERKKAKRELASEKRRFQTLVEEAPFGIMMVGEDGSFQYINRKFKEYFGYDLSEIPNGKEWFIKTFPDPDYRHEATSTWIDDLKKAKPGEWRARTYRVTCKDGTEKVIRFRSVQLGTGEYLISCEDITERKRAQDEIRTQRDFLNTVMESLTHPFQVIDANDYTILMANAASNLDLSGRESTCYALTHNRNEPCNSSDHICPLEQVKKTGMPSTVEHVHYDKDGRVRNVEIHAYPVLDRKGNVAQVIEYSHDITERKRAEKEERETTARLKALLNASPDIIYFKDPNGRNLIVNQGLANLVGMAEQDILGKTDEQLLPIDLAEQCRKSDQDVLKRSRPVYVEESMLTDTRETVFLETIKFPVLDDQSNLVGLGGVSRDVTARKQVEEALKTSEEQMRLLVEASPIGIGTVINGRYKYVNPTFLKIFGYQSAEEISGLPAESLFAAEDRELVLWRHRQGSAGRPLDPYYEVTGLRKDGEMRRLAVWGTAIQDKGEHGLLAFFIDLTETESLRTQLLQAQKLEAVGTLAGGVAHDFNNILQVALGYSELILDDEGLPERYRADLKHIYDAARRGADLVQRLLTFSRKSEIKPQPLKLNRRINEMRKMIERTIPKMIEIHLTLAEDLATINADPTQVDQVLMNLAVNARDAMPDGGKLTIETANITLDEEYAKTHLGAKPGRYVLLMVTDTGAGMDKETLDHIFEPFFTTKAVGEGTGLGLAMVHGIIQQHGGFIRCYSEPGAGTTFEIYFPSVVSDEAPEERTAEPMSPGGSEIILLVDDEEIIRDLCSRILTKAGYSVITASNGKDALEVYQARSDEIALVILDLIMPEMGGEQCLDGLLSLDPSVKVVIASGYSVSGPTKDALASGASGFVNKPYDMRQVLEVVRHVLDEK